jgi:prepilin-type N-terminal cleavage/methylation domain-containing protein
MRTTPIRRRAGFTLVELLVVITIIAILVALTAAAVVRALVKMDEAKTRNDISQLAGGFQAFKTKFQVPYVPSVLRLKTRVAYNTQSPAGDYNALDPIDVESLTWLKSVWPRLGATPNPQMTAPQVDWHRTGANPATAVIPSTVDTLQGDQVAVFILGGYRDANGNCFGFSSNPVNPMAPPTTGEARLGPEFEFPPARLRPFIHDLNASAPSPSEQLFPSFVDVYGTLPYLYFSAGKAGNDYPTQVQGTGTVVIPITLNVDPTNPASKCTIYPYQTSGIAPDTPLSGTAAMRVFANKSEFQIIAGGRDTVFGYGGLNWPGAGGTTSQTGYDDMSNFHPTLIGIPVQ